jgi:hypothetical protein
LIWRVSVCSVLFSTLFQMVYHYTRSCCAMLCCAMPCHATLRFFCFTVVVVVVVRYGLRRVTFLLSTPIYGDPHRTFWSRGTKQINQSSSVGWGCTRPYTISGTTLSRH